MDRDASRSEVDRKGASIRIRVTDEQKRLLTVAAERAGLDVSSWLRSLGIERAREMGVK